MNGVRLWSTICLRQAGLLRHRSQAETKREWGATPV
jgi:hypothetical protein